VTPQGRPITDGDLTVWSRSLSDGSVAVAFYNELDTPASISVDFVALGWDATTSAKVRDLWAHADLGVATGRYPATGGVAVAPHETHVVRLTKQ
jgi:alpha-galactosidase